MNEDDTKAIEKAYNDGKLAGFALAMEEAKGLVEALEFYADLDSWKSSVSGDYIIDRIRYDDLETKHYNMSNPSVGGKQARQALKEFKEKVGE